MKVRFVPHTINVSTPSQRHHLHMSLSWFRADSPFSTFLFHSLDLVSVRVLTSRSFTLTLTWPRDPSLNELNAHSITTLLLVLGTWARIGNVGITFKEYMEKMLNEEIKALSQGTPGSAGIVTSFVRAADLHNIDYSATSDVAGRKKGLFVDEIFGSLFFINFASHDTTVNTLAFAMLLLAANLDV